MKKTGIILELDKNQAILLTDQAEFMNIRSKPGMFVGQKVDISAPRENWFIIPKNRFAFGLATSLAILFVFFFILFGLFRPSGLYAYVAMDINPSIELAVDRQIRVINVKSINHDGLMLLHGMNFKNMSLNKAVMGIVAKAEQNRYFRNTGKNYMLLSVAAMKTNPGKPEIKKWWTDLKQTLADQNIRVYLIESTVKHRNIGLKNGLSMGRYELYIQARKAGRPITLNEAKISNVSTLLHQAGVIANDRENMVLVGEKPVNGNGIEKDIPRIENDGINPENQQVNDNNPVQDKPETNNEPENTISDNNPPLNTTQENTPDMNTTGSANPKNNSGSSTNDPADHKGGSGSGSGSGTGGGRTGGDGRSGGGTSGGGTSSGGSGGGSGGHR